MFDIGMPELIVIFIVAGAIFSGRETGQVAGVSDSVNFKQALINVEEQNDSFLDQGQQVIDRSIGIEVKASRKAERAIRK